MKFHFALCVFAAESSFARTIIDARVRRRATAGKGGKGKGSYSTSEDLTLPTEELTLVPDVGAAGDPDDSNDSSHLERICGLFGDFHDSASDACEPFDAFNDLMCPNDYEIQKICSAKYVAIDEAIVGEYCEPLFAPLGDVSDDPCVDLCKSFVADAGCCNLSCVN